VIICVNGQFVPEEQALISVFDRGFLYGDGLFETMRVDHQEPFQWAAHHDRLQRGANFLRMHLPYDHKTLRHYAAELIRANRMPEAILRLQVTRGRGLRGYGVQGAGEPNLVMTLDSLPATARLSAPRWRLATSTLRVFSQDPLVPYKTCNRLGSILAQAEAQSRGVDEALLLNEHGQVVETSSANLFWMAGDEVYTPPLNAGALPGITRAVVLDICQQLTLATREKAAPLAEIKRADCVFLTSSTWGIVEVNSLDEVTLGSTPLLATLRAAYEQRRSQEPSTALR
jgi:branched-chain amino acid aminotransferase